MISSKCGHSSGHGDGYGSEDGWLVMGTKLTVKNIFDCEEPKRIARVHAVDDLSVFEEPELTLDKIKYVLDETLQPGEYYYDRYGVVSINRSFEGLRPTDKFVLMKCLAKKEVDEVQLIQSDEKK